MIKKTLLIVFALLVLSGCSPDVEDSNISKEDILALQNEMDLLV